MYLLQAAEKNAIFRPTVIRLCVPVSANFTKKLILRHFVAILLVASIALIVLGGMRRYVKLLSIRESSMERYTPVRNKQIRGEIVNNYSGAELAVMHVCPVLPEELHLGKRHT